MNQKPAGFVSYGGAGGARVIEQLRQVVIALQMHPIQATIIIPLEILRAVQQGKGAELPLSEMFRPLREGRMDPVRPFFSELVKLTRVLKPARVEPVSKG